VFWITAVYARLVRIYSITKEKLDDIYSYMLHGDVERVREDDGYIWLGEEALPTIIPID
jgi:hypothetical protein